MRLRRLLCLALLVCAAPAFAQGTLVVTNTNDSGPGSLRSALQLANTTSGPQTIVFNIPTSDPGYFGGTFSIQPNSDYTLTDDGTTVDATTQTAFTGNTNPDGPEVNLFGLIISPGLGFNVQSDNNVIRGFGGFEYFRYGIEISGNNNRVEGCEFRLSFFGAVAVRGDNNVIGGTAPGTGNDLSESSTIGIEIAPLFGSSDPPTGNVIQGNVIAFNHTGGVLVDDIASGTVIGGTDPAARNYIYANGHTSGGFDPVGYHVELAGNDNTVQGNWIGLNEAGADASGLALDAVRISGSNNALVRNVIGGMDTFDSEPRVAVRVSGGTGNSVRGNLIGTDPTGTQPRTNTLGVVAEVGSVVIGGAAPGDGNTIAYSSANGVFIDGIGTDPTGVAALGNTMFENDDVGIDLNADEFTANDLHDPDTGANRLQNHPAIASASLNGGALTVTYAVDTAPTNATYPLRVEFFRADADGTEGQVFLGADTYTAADYNAGQPGSKTATLDVGGSGLGVGDLVLATATDGANNTSEFGVPEAVIGGGAVVAVSAEPVGGPVVIGAGGGSFQFIVTLTNTTSQPQSFQAWTSVTGPVSRNPVLGPQAVTLPAGATVTRTLTQRVPGAAPAGAYTHAVNVGTFPGVVLASDGFPAVKEAGRLVAGASASGTAGHAEEWAVSGWDAAATTAVTAGLPGTFALSEAHPNPSSGRVRLMLSLPAAEQVTVAAYDALGRRVALLHDGPLAAGQHAFALDGSSLPAGLYVIRVTGETFATARRAILVRE